MLEATESSVQTSPCVTVSRRGEWFASLPDSRDLSHIIGGDAVVEAVRSLGSLWTVRAVDYGRNEDQGSVRCGGDQEMVASATAGGCSPQKRTGPAPQRDRRQPGLGEAVVSVL